MRTKQKNRDLDAFGWTFSAIALLISVPLSHTAINIGYDLLGTNGLSLVAAVIIVSIPLAWIAGRPNKFAPVLVFTGLASLLFDYFMEAPPYTILIGFFFACAAATLFWKIGANSAKIIVTFCLAFIASDFLGAAPSKIEYRKAGTNTVQPLAEQIQPKPSMIHIIFDAFQAPTALPEQLASTTTQIRQFFVARGFYLHEQAFSRYNFTTYSLATALNFKKAPEQIALTDKKMRGAVQYAHTLTQNHALVSMDAKGFETYIIQTDFLDICGDFAKINPSHCLTYKFNRFPAEHLQGSSELQRLQLLALFAAERSFLFENIREYANKYKADFIPDISVPFTAAALEGLRHTEAIIQRVGRPSYILSHNLLPHAPFVLDGECRLQQPSKWVSGYSEKGMRPPNSDYVRYGQQLSCSLKALGNILDTIEENPILQDATLIIHGDHGSRLMRPAPDNAESDNPMSFHLGSSIPEQQVIKDQYFTLFAVRHPALGPGINSRPASLDKLLTHYLACQSGDPYQTGSDSVLYIPQEKDMWLPFDFEAMQYIQIAASLNERPSSPYACSQ